MRVAVVAVSVIGARLRRGAAVLLMVVVLRVLPLRHGRDLPQRVGDLGLNPRV